jgi:hypothetical protein
MEVLRSNSEINPANRYIFNKKWLYFLL